MYRVRCSCLLVLGLASCAASGPVRTGLDDAAHLTELLGGKRVGVIANATARDAQGRFIVDVLRALPQVRVTALFAPEHGLQAQLGAGDRVLDETFQGLTVYSLYGKTRQPTPAMLAEVDALVFDIQDVGARFYTYASTMTLAMAAAAECGKPFVVLDRPNPINGRTVEGNLLEPAFASFVGLWPIPVRHGLTMGELARLVAGEGWLKGPRPPDLTVVPVQGWRRSMWFDQTHLAFIRPSPNIPDPDTALVYIGLCLLEGTNVSEGRGTDRPFMQFGAPWVDGQALCTRLEALRLPGLAFEPTSFADLLETRRHTVPRCADHHHRPRSRRILLERHPHRPDAACHGPGAIRFSREPFRPPLRHGPHPQGHRGRSTAGPVTAGLAGGIAAVSGRSAALSAVSVTGLQRAALMKTERIGGKP